MASFASSLLDELMGRNRNVDPTNKGKDIEWSDSEVCKFFLCGFCPHELFTNTRADLGNCDKIHDDELVKNYNKSSRCLRMGYEEQFLSFLQNLISEVDRRIRRGHQRLALNAAHINEQGSTPGVQDEKIQMLSERINELVEQAEALGCEGRVEEAQGVLKLCDQLKEERIALQEAAKNNPNQMIPKEMEVCPVCGAFLVVGDAQQRVEEHLSGKQHMGYAKVRTTIDNIKKKLRGEDPEREARLALERTEREKEKEKEREREKEREKRRGEDETQRHGREKRDEHRHHRSSSKSRKRSRSRSRHSDKKSRDRSRDRHHRSKDSHKSHRRSRSQSPGHRHSSRDRKSRDHTSSSKDKHKDRRSQDRSGRNGEPAADRSNRADIDAAKSGDSV